MSAIPRSAPAIHAVDRHSLPLFFDYLDDHLQDNGRNGMPLFQPMPRSQSAFSPDKAAAFTRGLEVAIGQPGWRRAWIAAGHEGILGHVDLRARPETASAHRALLGMGVHRAARRQGLGRALLASAMQWARDATALDWVDLEVLSDNVPARALYRDAGFRVCGEIPDMFRIDGEPLAYTLMSLQLARPDAKRRLGLE